MKDKSKIAAIVGAVLVLALVISLAVDRFAPGQTVSASGSSEVQVTPDIVGVYLTVKTNGTTSQEAKDANSEVSDAVVEALMDLGLEREEIETTSFYVGENYDWDTYGRELDGYVATNSLRVRVSADNLLLANSVIDGAVDAGALLNYVNYELSPELESEYKVEALKAAAEDARTKAEAIAEGLGAKVGRVVSTTDSSFNYYARDYVLESASYDGAAGLKVDIQPADQTIYGQVTVTYKLR